MCAKSIRYQLPTGEKTLFGRIPSFSLVKAAMNAPHRWKLRKECLTCICYGAMLLTKRLHFLFFQLLKAEQRPVRTSELVA